MTNTWSGRDCFSAGQVAYCDLLVDHSGEVDKELNGEHKVESHASAGHCRAFPQEAEKGWCP